MSLTKVSFSMVQGSVVNVLDYGTFDTATNTTSAINAAIAAATAAGKTLYFPAGTYSFNAILTFTCSVVGENMNSTVLQATGNALSDTVYSVRFGSGAVGYRRLQVSNLFIKGDGTTTANNGVVLDHPWFSKFTNIRVGDFYGIGLAVSQESYWNVFENIECGRDSVGVSVTPSIGLALYGSSGHGITASTFTNCYFSGRVYGIEMLYGDQLIFNNLEVSGAPIGVYCPASNTNIQINALYAELNNTACIQGGSSSLCVNGISWTGSAAIWTVSPPTTYFERTGAFSHQLIINKTDLVTNWVQTVDDTSEDLVLTQGRAGGGNYRYLALGPYAGLKLSGSNATWTSGSGSPEGSVTAPVGSVYTNLSGGANTTLYVKESGTGNTGWVAK